MSIRRLLRSIADALVWFHRAVVRCDRSLRQDCLNGLAAYALAMHGLPPDCNWVSRCGQPTEDPITPPDQRLDIEVLGQRSRQSAQGRETSEIPPADLRHPSAVERPKTDSIARSECTTGS
jgi:hypothetical protein